MNRHAGWLLLAVWLAGGVAVCQQRELPRENVRAKAKIKGVRPGLLAVVTEDGDQWLVKVDAKPQDISFVASASPQWLQRGMLVKFQNTFDKKGKPLDTVRQLEVISVRADTKLGLVPVAKFGEAAKLFSDEDESSKKKKAPNSMAFSVAGTLRGYKDGKMLVAAGRTLVQSQLGDKAKISVNVSDYSLAREGDAIDLSGWYYAGRKDRVFANRITISASRTLGEPESQPEPKKKQSPNKKDAEKTLEELFST